MNDDDFKRIVIDYISMVTLQRHEEIMTSNQDVMDAIAKVAAAQTRLDTTVHTAISDMGMGGEEARAGFVKVLGDVATQMGALETKLTAAVAEHTSPPATPPAA